MKSIAILGRQPAIGLAELESLYGADCISEIAPGVAGIDLEAEQVDFKRLGGTIKLAKFLATIDSSNWNDIENYLLDTTVEHQQYVPEGKLTIGLSAYGFKISPKQINATALSIKKAVKQTGRSVRIVPNTSHEMSSAQILHNKLISSNGWELLLVRQGNKTILALTTNIQDIEAYADRDQARPMRDARVGMLPPKLAQILINLAVGNSEDGGWKMEDGAHSNDKHPVVFDPFCGTGVLLQEALLMNYTLAGSDLEPRMVEYTVKNMEWLNNTHNLGLHNIDFSKLILQADATEVILPDTAKNEVFVACETYLGRPFSSEPDSATLRKVIQDVDTIHEKFLINVAQQTKSGFRMCIAVPAWFIKGRVHHLKTLDSLEKLGYTRQSFAHSSNKELIYHREGQVVGRELVVLTRTEKQVSN